MKRPLYARERHFFDLNDCKPLIDAFLQDVIVIRSGLIEEKDELVGRQVGGKFLFVQFETYEPHA